MSIFEVLSIVGPIIGGLVGLAGWLASNTYKQDKKETETVFKSLHAKNEKQDDENKRVVERLHSQELKCQALEYELKLANKGSENILVDIEEIKENMVTKGEFGQLVKSIDDMSKRFPGRYSSSSSTPFPPKNR